MSCIDVVLPEMSGYGCAAHCERFGETLPIIFVSGSRIDSLDSVAGLHVGADDYIVSPFVSEAPRTCAAGADPLRAEPKEWVRLAAWPRKREVREPPGGGARADRDRLPARDQPEDGRDASSGSSASSTFAAGRRR